jgi:hypothetical protein
MEYETVNLYAPGLQWYVDKLRNGERFAFVRYGNGEWDCILDLYYRTRSGSQRFSPDLRKALMASLTQPRGGAYFTALQSVSFLGRLGLLPKAEAWCAANASGLTWHDGEIFTRASRTGKLYPLVEALRGQRVVVVGPQWLMKLPFASVFVPVKSRDCWAQIEDIEAQLRGLQNVVVAFSAGPAAKVLIHRLQPVIGKHSWLIDFGSLWDPYCGVRSRSYHKRITPDIIRRNLEGK